jgi:hypothetical protein
MFQCKKQEAVNDRFLRDMYAGNGKQLKISQDNSPPVRVCGSSQKIALDVQ